VVVAFPVSNIVFAQPTNPTLNTILLTAQPKMATAIFGFGLAHALENSSGLVRKNVKY